jgi:hypothetical protein
MEKAPSPVPAKLSLAENKDFAAKAPRIFVGTTNPRHLRVLRALLVQPTKRKEIDHIAGTSNGPELIAELRRRGLSIPCEMRSGKDRDGNPVKFGVYDYSQSDRYAIIAWLQMLDRSTD